MSDATSEHVGSDDASRETAARLSMKIAALMTALTLGPMAALTWLAALALSSDAPFLSRSIYVFGWTLLVVNVASARCRNVVARWLLLGPGDFKVRATFGLLILSGDWLLTGLLTRALAPEGPMRVYVTVAWMTGMASALPFLWWLIVRVRGGRDVVPGVRFFARTFGIRDLLLGLFLVGLALAAARIAFAFAAPAGGSFYLSTEFTPGFLPPVLSSIGFWATDAGLRLLILGKHASVRGFVILAGLLLVLAVIAVTAAAENVERSKAFLIFFPFFVYPLLGAAHEGALRGLGVRAVNLRSEDLAGRPADGTLESSHRERTSDAS